MTHPPAQDGPPSESRTQSSHAAESTATTGRLFASCSLYEALGVYLTATIVFRAINFGRVVLLTWFMTRAEFGVLNLILLVANVLTPLCGLGLPDGLARYAPRHEARGSLRRFFRPAARSVALVAAAALIVLTSLGNPLGRWAFQHAGPGDAAPPLSTSSAPGASSGLARNGSTDAGTDASTMASMSALIVASQVLYFSLLAALKGLRLFRAMAWTEITHGVLFLLGSLAALLIGRRTAVDLSSVYVLSIAVPLIFFTLGLRGHVARDPNQTAPLDEPRVAASLLRFGIWTASSGLVWQAMIYYATWALNRTHGPQSVAVFSASRQIGQIILIIAVSVSTVVMTSITRTWETQGRAAAFERLAAAFRAIALGLFLICAALSLAKNWIILLFRPEYAAGAEVIPLHMCFFLIGGYLSILPAHFYLLEKTRRALWPWLIGLAVNIAAASLLAQEAAARFLANHNGASSPLTAAWHWLSTHLLVVGFEDPMGLGPAAWCAAIAAAAALLTCVLLLMREGVRLDRGAFILIGAAALLTTKPIILAVGSAAMVLLALRTEWLITRAQRTTWIEQARHALHSLIGRNRPAAP